MPRRRNSIRIQDVAAVAGVSVSTVSRVLNDKDDVAEETYERVQKVIQELGYTANLAARSMRSRRTNVVGMVVPDVEQPFSIAVMKGVNHAVAESDSDLIVYTSGSAKRKSIVERERHYVALLSNSITDGVIVVAPTATDLVTHSPVVAVDFNHNRPSYPGVISTNREGALAATRHLLELGHKRIGYIGGRPDLLSAERRLLGYKNAHEMAAVPLQPELIEIGDYSSETGYVCAQRLLDLAEPPTAIFAANDQSAFSVLQAAHDRGLDVPGDLSVVGFDNTLESALTDPPLTTVDQSLTRMGYLAAKMLFALIQGDDQGDDLQDSIQKVPTKLVIRSSTAPPAC